MTVEVTLVEHPLVAVPARGLRPRTPSSSGSLALALSVMTVEVTLVEHPLVAVSARGLCPRTPFSSGSLALARPSSDAHVRTPR